jgi:hypothetical protein
VAAGHQVSNDISNDDAQAQMEFIPMIVAVYVIGSAVALIVLTIRLHDTRDQLRRIRRERNTYARTTGTSLLVLPDADWTAVLRRRDQP